MISGEARWSCNECQADQRTWERRGRCGAQKISPTRIADVVPIAPELSTSVDVCPISLSRAPWVDAVIDLRVRSRTVPQVIPPNPKPALVEALMVAERAAGWLQEADRQKKERRAELMRRARARR